MLRKFAAFPEIQVIDLDAALGRGSNDDLVRMLASQAVCRVGGGVRTVERARALLAQGAHRVIVGTSAFTKTGVNHALPRRPARRRGPRPPDSSRSIPKTAASSSKAGRKPPPSPPKKCSQSLEPYCAGFLCTYVDKEGMMQGTDLDWFRRLRAATTHAITAAGGITTLDDVRRSSP